MVGPRFFTPGRKASGSDRSRAFSFHSGGDGVAADPHQSPFWINVLRVSPRRFSPRQASPSAWSQSCSGGIVAIIVAVAPVAMPTAVARKSLSGRCGLATSKFRRMRCQDRFGERRNIVKHPHGLRDAVVYRGRLLAFCV